MKPKPKIDKDKLCQLLRQGSTLTECAKIFGCSVAAVSVVKRNLNLKVARSTDLADAERAKRGHLDAVAQLRTINNHANDLLTTAIDSEDHDTALRCMSEIRNQLKLQNEIFALLFDARAVQQFQEEVLAAIGEIAPDVRERIIDNLKKASALRSALAIA
jgi:hypothetical protein